MTRVVIESPLGALTHAGIQQHQAYARRAVLDSLRRGEAPYASHLFYAHPEILDDLLPEQRALGLLAGLTWAAQASTCAVYLDRGLTPGMELGIAQARRLGMRIVVRYLDDVTRRHLPTLATTLHLAGFTGVLSRNRLEIFPAVYESAAAGTEESV